MFQPDGAYTTTPCVCLVLGNVAFPSSIFNRLLVSCMSLWPIAKSKDKHHIYCGCGQFCIDRQHRLTLSFIRNVIQLRITRYSKKDIPSVQLCKEVLNTVKLSLWRIGKCLSLELDIEECVKCPFGGAESTCRHSVQEIQGYEEVLCDNHDDVAVLDSAELLKYWFESEVADNVSTCIMIDHSWLWNCQTLLLVHWQVTCQNPLVQPRSTLKLTFYFYFF